MWLFQHKRKNNAGHKTFVISGIDCIQFRILTPWKTKQTVSASFSFISRKKTILFISEKRKNGTIHQSSSFERKWIPQKTCLWQILKHLRLEFVHLITKRNKATLSLSNDTRSSSFEHLEILRDKLKWVQNLDLR